MKKISTIASAVLLVAASVLLFITAPLSNVLAAETGTATEKGNGGDVTVTVTLENGKITDIQTKHGETGGLGEEAINRLVEQAIKNQSVELDVVSGASLTSNAFITALSKAIEKAGGDVKSFQGKKEEVKEKTEETMETEVVVVGAGGGGFAAAVSAKQAGADVVLLEKLPVVGGNTLISGGEYAAPGNWLQAKEGIEDSPENFAKDIEAAGGDPELIKVVAENATETAEWLRDEIGVKWLDSLMFFGGHSVKRSLIPEGHTGNELISKYKVKAEELDIPVLTEHDVKEILTEDGKIVGVKVETPTSILTVKAKAVVLASGGFGANKEMLYDNDPEVDDHVLSTNSPGATGDGITMAQALNADTTGMDKIQLYPICDTETGKLLYVGDTRLVGGALLVNKEGKRFVEELDTRRAISLAIKEQTDHVGYLVWDEASSEKTGTIHSHPAEAESLFERGLLHKADTLDELAEHFGIDKEQLKETVANFNENSKNEKDPEWNLRMLGWTIEEGPYYMLKAGPAVHHTMGGLKINTEAQVMNKDGEPIKGLYGAGEVTGGIHGSNRLGSSAMADISVFGRIAGKNAAEFVKE
ncbi:flavocytochrome c [Tuanshanicoccus lijuaniae]|uniref:flavocytochrome c n=1 Tax=Aerococcaceae bacterium zg-1292 TaxID=2774330 RepID=UPI001934EBC8|nr:flavocytochrome c [Aerococcaceae bacterium zg-1292]QQA36810.1 flavocytochrome c [Aerococcaceae bacterium zg-1292]